MNILYIHQYFKTPEEGGCVRSYHLTKGLVENGHEVSVITAYNGEKPLTKEIDGVKVYYLPVPYSNKLPISKRVSAFIKFISKAIKQSSKIKSVDLAYVMTTPLSTGIIALWLKRFKKIPYLFEVGDLWPEVPIQMRIIRYRLIKSITRRLEKLCYKNADQIIALSPEIKSYIQKVVPDKRVFTLPNFCDNELFQPQYENKTKELRILYCGTVGLANRLEYMVNIAKLSQELNLPISFTVVGDGAKLDAIKHISKDLKNFRVLPFCNQVQLQKIIAEHDAFYVSFQNIRVLHSGSPNKFFDGLASGKLIISNLDGWTREIIEIEECGFYYSPIRPSEFIQKVTPYLDSQSHLTNAQQNSRYVAEEYFGKDKMIQLQNDIITGKAKFDQLELPY